jgi:pteridine reductase
MDLNNKKVLITGASRRIGMLTAQLFAQHGAQIIAHYQPGYEDEMNTVIAELNKNNCIAQSISADLSKPEDIANMFEYISNTYGAIDILINSAATFFNSQLHDISSEEWDYVMAVNVRAPFLCSQSFDRLHKKLYKNDNSGVIINIADMSGIHAWSNYVHHGVSKAGLIHLTRILARSLAPRVRVNAIVPGLVSPPPGLSDNDENWLLMQYNIPLKKAGTMEDVAQAALFLVNHDFTHGTVLTLDGGETLVGPLNH